MSSSKSLQNHVDIVANDVRTIVMAYRHAGHKTVSAIAEVAILCGVSPSRIHTLFFTAQTAAVRASERRRLCLAIADAFDRLADELEAQAANAKGVAGRIRHRETLWGTNAGCTEFGTSSQKAAA